MRSIRPSSGANSGKDNGAGEHGERQHDDQRQKICLCYADGEIGLLVSPAFHLLTNERKPFLPLLLGRGQIPLSFCHYTMLLIQIVFLFLSRQTGDCKKV